MLEAKNLVKEYGARRAVDDVSFRLEPGEIVGFLGPNGAGKSTTLRMLVGFLEPTAGSVEIRGVDVGAEPRKALEAIGYMPETVPLYPEMRVREYLAYRARLKGITRKSVSKRVDESLELAHVSDARDRIIGQLSKGYRQRVGLADALVADPPILVLDEPTSGLDPNQIRGVRDVIRSFAGKKTVLLSTHILPEVEGSCSRVVIIDRGRVIGQGAPSELRARQGAAVVVVARAVPDALKTLVEAVDGVVATTPLPDEGGLAALRAEVRAPDVAESIFAAAARANVTLRELRSVGASLEDVFTRLTTREAADAAKPTAGDANDGESGSAEETPS